jgi:single-stranded DNA-binding protein
MESIKITGEITTIHPVEIKSEKFSVQRFAVKESEGKYPNTFEVQCTGKTIGVLNDYKVGDKVVVNANLNGREYTSKSGQQGVFMSLGLWKIEKLGAQHSGAQNYSQGFDPNVPF